MARQIEVAAREGGGDAETNAALRTVVLKANAGQMTNEAIDRAIKRGSGEATGANYESITYEGYGPGGVAMLVDVLTDNRNRTASDVRLAFSKFGGAMAEPGAVGWQFSRRGVIIVDGVASEDDVMTVALESGADDIERDGDVWRVTTEPSTMMTPLRENCQPTAPGSAMEPPNLEKARRTSEAVRLRLSVSTSTNIATPPGA